MTSTCAASHRDSERDSESEREREREKQRQRETEREDNDDDDGLQHLFPRESSGSVGMIAM